MDSATETIQHTATLCPGGCGKKLDASLPLENCRSPKPGDLTACAYCATPLIFGDGLKLRLLTAEELAELPADLREELRRVREALALYRLGETLHARG